MGRADRIIIVAMTENRIIGHRGSIPWRIPEELRLFRELTVGHSVIMGRRTFLSIGGPLPERHNIVVSKRLEPRPGMAVCGELAAAVDLAGSYGKKVFFIGGVEIYRAALPLVDYLYVSWIRGEHEGDTRFPSFSLKNWQVRSQKDYGTFLHVVYRRAEKAVEE